jgi:hypothetical protein
VGPQHDFPIPNGILEANGSNTIAIAVWNTDATSGGLGTVSLESFGSYASSLRVDPVNSPRYDAQTYAMPKPHDATLQLAAPDTATPGQTATATARFSVPSDAPPAGNVQLRLHAPDGWTVTPTTPTATHSVHGGQQFTASWQVTAPQTMPAVAQLTASADYVQRHDQQHLADPRDLHSLPSAPTGNVYPSDLPFFSATNGWGPVERDTSNGEQAAGDGHPITLNGTVYKKGLGTNAVSDVAVYLGGNCSRFTATVGVDDEKGSSGSVTFSVVSDGKTLATTPVLTGSSASVNLDVDITGTQLLELVVGDGGDGNGNDHGDWADAKLSCA